MGARKGDRIVVESEQVGQAPREGEMGLRYLVRWGDGHETMLTPSAGSAHIVPARAKRTPTKRSKRDGRTT